MNYAVSANCSIWINRNISEGTAICVDTNSIAPYEVPPFDFWKYKIRDDNCQYLVKVHRHVIDMSHPNGYHSLKAFTPRFYTKSFPLVFEHINPVIFIYQFDATTLR